MKTPEFLVRLKLKRANDGHLKCEHDTCRRPASRVSTPGLTCVDHAGPGAGKLDWAKDTPSR